VDAVAHLVLNECSRDVLPVAKDLDPALAVVGESLKQGGTELLISATLKETGKVSKDQRCV